MAAHTDVLIEIIEQQMDICMAFNDDAILDEAKSIAYYAAMIDAAEDDPMDDVEDQEKILAYLKDSMKDHVERYQQLINNKLP